jgi:WYL domain
MSINKFALIRYKTIDNCLQNRFRKWTLEDLVEACSEALYEYEGITKGVSLRTIQLDIQNMRSDKLGYNAPIVVKDKKFYTYEEKNYSITNTPITSQDLGTLDEVVDILRQFKGFGYFKDLDEMVTRLEDKVIKQKNRGRSFIEFERNDLLRGLNYIDPLHRYIIDKKVIEVLYKSFKAREASPIPFHPYLLKEYRNRWFLLGRTDQRESLVVLALDRIEGVSELSSIRYKKSHVDITRYYDDVIGVTKSERDRASVIVFRVDKFNAPYIITKPLHPSQIHIKQEGDWSLFSINVVVNFELEKELLAFGETIEVLGPRRLRGRIKSRLQKAAQLYERKEPI